MIVLMAVVGALAVGGAATLVVWASRGGAVVLSAMDGNEAVEVRNLNEVIRRLEADESVRVAILTGAGRAFCAGLDLKELASGQNVAGEIPEERKAEINLATPLKAFGRPIIGAINGVAITGGFELALACDILIASTEARFADNHNKIAMINGQSDVLQHRKRLTAGQKKGFVHAT